MRRLGIHSFVWTGGQTQDGLEMALEKSAEHGYRTIEFAYLKPELFDLDRLARKAQSLDVEIGVTMGLPLSRDISSEDPDTVAARTIEAGMIGRLGEPERARAMLLEIRAKMVELFSEDHAYVRMVDTHLDALADTPQPDR